MKPSLLFCVSILVALCACAPAPTPNEPSAPGFFYRRIGPDPALVVQDAPDSSQPRKVISLAPPPDCTFWALSPAPVGRWIAVEWECPSGTDVEAFDTLSGKYHALIPDPSLDSHFLAWYPDGRQVYLKIGTLSYPQIVRVDVENGQAESLSLSAFTYDLTVAPDGVHMLYSLSNGIGFGSETWFASADGKDASQLVVDPQNILGLMHYSPDGKHVAYIRLPDSQETYPPGELWIMGSNGGNAHRVASADAGRGMPPVWSPDGSRIAFVGRDQPDDPDSTNLSILDVSRGQVTRLQAQPLTPPVWSPDGSRVVFSVAKNNASAAGNDTMQVWFYEPGTGKSGLLLDNACCAGWLAGNP